MAEEWEKREADNERQIRIMNKQIEMMGRLLEHAEARMEREKVTYSLTLMKLTESEDIKAYLNKFERMMGACEVEEAR